MGKSIIGKKVYIKNNVESWAAGEWGIIKDFDGEYYYISIANDPEIEIIFSRNEFTIKR